MNNLTYDKTKEGWFLVKNVQRRLTSCSIEVVSYLHKYGGSHGDEVLKRAIELDADYSQADAEYLLEHQNEIPSEFRSYTLIFTGTIWRGTSSIGLIRYIPCLEWSWLRANEGQWGLRFAKWFSETRWGSNTERLIRVRGEQKNDGPKDNANEHGPA